MVIFAMVYSNFYPLVGEYEKREVYDDVDGKYATYWLKQMIESAVYDIGGSEGRHKNLTTYGYVRFECRDLNETDSKTVCRNVVSSLQINGCDPQGNYCDIFITYYQIGSTTSPRPDFKNTVKNNLKRYKENCPNGVAESTCKTNLINRCKAERTDIATAERTTFCTNLANSKVFTGGFQDYIVALPDYITPSLNYANYRVIAVTHNQRDNNNFYTYETMEIAR